MQYLIQCARIDPFSPWSTLHNNFRLNGKDPREFTFISSHGEHKVAVTPAEKAGSVDIAVTLGEDQATKTYTNVSSHWDDDGQVISSIDDKKVKSNVVAKGEKITVFDEVHLNESEFSIPPNPAILQ